MSASEPKYSKTQVFVDGNGDSRCIVDIEKSGDKWMYLGEEVIGGGRFWFMEYVIEAFGGTDQVGTAKQMTKKDHIRKARVIAERINQARFAQSMPAADDTVRLTELLDMVMDAEGMQ